MSPKTVVHLPKQRLDIEGKPVIFTLGPIRNAPLWHDEAIGFFVTKDTDAIIACPARKIREEFHKFMRPADFQKEPFPRQRAWERYYLDKAAYEGGVVMVWLPGEALPKENPEKLYGHISQLELGRWAYIASINPYMNFVIGTDGNYPEWDMIRYDLLEDLPNLIIHNSLEACCEEAHKLTTEYWNSEHLFAKRNRDGKKPVTAEEFQQRLYYRKPQHLFITEWSRKIPLYTFTELTPHSVTYTCAAHADKSPRETSYLEFYNSLRFSGLSCCRPSGNLETTTSLTESVS
jgi:hypothetical protein